MGAVWPSICYRRQIAGKKDGHRKRMIAGAATLQVSSFKERSVGTSISLLLVVDPRNYSACNFSQLWV